LITWRAPAPAGQTITGTVVFGDVIQISGVAGEVTVATDRPPYRMEAFPVAAASLSPERARAQPSRLLLPRYQVVPFTGRDDELVSLAAWMGAGEAVSVRLVHAGGGQGKTRLAGHVAAACATAGWAVWRALHTPTATAGSRVDLPAGGGALVVVDYADRWQPSHLISLLTHLHGVNLRSGIVLRVLLLARSAGFWWHALADRLDGDLDLHADAQDLVPLGGQVDRAELFHTAQRQFANAMQLDAAVSPAPAGLDGSGYAQVLAVHMAALAAVDACRHGTAPPAEPHAVSAYLLRREYTHWQTLHGRAEDRIETPPTVMRRAVYMATLAGALHRADARAALSRVALASTPVDADRIIDDHRFCYPPENPATVLGPLYPDRLGEDMLALSTPGHPHANDGGAWSPDDWASDAAHTLLATGDDAVAVWTPAAITVLVETARRWPHIATEVLYPLLRQRPELAFTAGGTTLTRLAVLPEIDPAVLEAVESPLPEYQHVDLDIAAAAVSTTLTRHRLAGTTDPAERARLHAAHVRRLSNAGRHQEALAAAEEATRIHRQLAEANPAAHLPSLAASLNNLGNQLSKLGRRGEALAAAEEATGIYRQLVEANPAAHLPSLAVSLNNLGTSLSVLGRRGEALAAAEEATRIHRQLAEANPTAHLPDLALALTNLGGCLLDMGRRQQALAPAEEAVAIRRRLAEANPAAYLPDLAASLNNLAAILSDMGRRQEALAPAEEAVAIRRRLAEANPAAYLPDLAASLNNLAGFLSDVGRRQEALAAAEEGVAIRRRLADANPATYLPTLTMALHDLGAFLSNVGRHQEAISQADEAVAIRRRLAEADPATYLPDLAMSLNNLAAFRSRVARSQEALESAQEATGIYRRLVKVNPGTCLPELAMSLNNLATFLSEMGRRQEALAPAEEALAIRQRLAKANPAAHLPDLADSLVQYAWVCAKGGINLPEACSAAQDAISILGPLTERLPEVFGVKLWLAYESLADVLDGLGHSEESAELRRELKEAISDETGEASAP